jgi:YbbR domain-containing protein
MRNNLSFKVLALVLAVTVWYLAKQEDEPIQISFFAPIVFTNVPPSLQVTVNPTQVNISAYTSARRSNAFNPSEVRAVLDLGQAQPGVYDYSITEENIEATGTLQMERISPSQVQLEIAQLVDKEFRLQPRYSGQLSEGFLLEDIEIVPPVVRLRGPQATMESFDVVMTKEIDLSGLNSSIDMLVQIDLPNSNLQILPSEFDYYTARVLVRALPIKKRFENVPIYLRNSEFVSLVNPNTFSLFLEGPPDIINNLSTSEVYGTVDLADYQPGDYQISPKPVVPKQVNVLQQWPVVSLWVKSTPLSNEEKIENERLVNRLTTPYPYPPQP